MYPPPEDHMPPKYPDAKGVRVEVKKGSMVTKQGTKFKRRKIMDFEKECLEELKNDLSLEQRVALLEEELLVLGNIVFDDGKLIITTKKL